jgi:hypothetical protein
VEGTRGKPASIADIDVGRETVIEVKPEVAGRSISKKDAEAWLRATRTLEKNLGRPVKPADFVTFARLKEGKSIRGFFTWDDRVAGEKYRVAEAAFYCRAVRIRFAEGVAPVRALVSVKVDDGERGYVSLDEAQRVPEYKQQVILDARRELRHLAAKLDSLVRWLDSPELARALEHVTRAIGELGPE